MEGVWYGQVLVLIHRRLKFAAGRTELIFESTYRFEASILFAACPSSKAGVTSKPTYQIATHCWTAHLADFSVFYHPIQPRSSLLPQIGNLALWIDYMKRSKCCLTQNTFSFPVVIAGCICSRDMIFPN